MIYKVVGNFVRDDFDDTLDQLSKKFKFLFQDSAIYLALFDYKQEPTAKDYIENSFNDDSEVLVITISEKNLARENQIIIDWCRDNFVRLERDKYQDEQQEKLQQAMKALDEFERILQENTEKTLQE